MNGHYTSWINIDASGREPEWTSTTIKAAIAKDTLIMLTIDEDYSSLFEELHSQLSMNEWTWIVLAFKPKEVTKATAPPKPFHFAHKKVRLDLARAAS